MSHSRSFVALLCSCAWPCAAAIAPAGEEFALKYGKANNEHSPVAAFASDGRGVVVWTDSRDGVRMKIVTAAGADEDSERVLAPNVHLPEIPGHGIETLTKDPALRIDPSNGSLWVFWTEETQDVTIDYFDERRFVLERDVRGRNFDAAGEPLGDVFTVNSNPEGYQSRPQVLPLHCDAPDSGCAAGSYVVAWESDDRAPFSRPGEGIFGRVYDGTGAPLSAQLRLSAPSEAKGVALAAGARGRFAAVWEVADGQGHPKLYGRFFQATGGATGRPFAIAAQAGGLQRRASLVWNPANDEVTVFFDRTLPASGRSRVLAQRVAEPGQTVGETQTLSGGPNDMQAVATLTHRNTAVVLWSVWKHSYPLAVDACELDGSVAPVGKGARMGLYPRFGLALAGAPDGRLLAVWEGYVFGGRQGLVARWITVK